MSVALFGGLLSRPLMIALATPPDILDQASAYVRVICYDAARLRLPADDRDGAGRRRLTPLLALALSTTIGLILTPLLSAAGSDSRHRLTAPPGRRRSANALTLLALAAYLRRKKRALAPDAEFLRLLRPDGACLKKSLASDSRARSDGGDGDCRTGPARPRQRLRFRATAAYGAVNQIMGYAQFTAMSISISVSILGAQAIGRGDTSRLDAIVRTGLRSTSS